ncbi:hypothetical protein [Kibdelosporangium philippinense]|uniref:hypothetical protein n=1 Tax=Kibdelosporangium philippinense TaxID=211113 RepID=UPI00360BD4F0
MIEELAERLDGAQLNAEDTPSLADTHEIDIDQAYEIQQAVVDRRLARERR